MTANGTRRLIWSREERLIDPSDYSEGTEMIYNLLLEEFDEEDEWWGPVTESNGMAALMQFSDRDNDPETPEPFARLEAKMRAKYDLPADVEIVEPW